MAAAIVAAVLFRAPAVTAQDAEAARPYQGLFEPETRSAAAPKGTPTPAIEFSARVFEQVALGPEVAAPNRGPWQSAYTAVDVALAGRRAGKRVRADVRGGAQLRSYHDTRGGEVDQQWVALDLDARLARRTALAVAARGGYAASYAPGSPLEGTLESSSDTGPPSVVELATLRNISLSSSARLSRRMGRRTDADVGLSVGGVKYLDSGVTVANIRGSGAVERLIRTGLTVGLGYDLGRVTSARGDGRLETDTHELTLTGRIAPSASRSTSIVVSAIPTLARRRVSGGTSGPAPEPPGAFTARLGARVGVEHRLSPRVRLGAGYQRALYLDDGFVQPSFVQAAGGRVEWAFSRRVTATASAAYSTGLAIATLPGSSLDRVDGMARVSVRVSRHAVFSLEYQSSDYQRRGALRAPSSTAYPGGQTLRLGVTLAPAPR